MDPSKYTTMWVAFAVACVIVSVAATGVRADGLIYQLPADRAWVRYDVRIKSTVKAEGKEPMQMDGRGTLVLSSVGQKSVNSEPCRWIEIAFEVSPPGAPNKYSRILKLLIPESRLKRGVDPFAHVREMYYSQGGLLPEIRIERIEQSEEIDGADYSRQQYELDRLRSVFPPPLKNLKSKRESVDTKLGNLQCEKLSGKGELSKSPLRGGGEWAWSGDFQCLLNEKVPFGVVSLRSQVKGFEKTKETFQFETEWILTVVEVGQDATSRLSTSFMIYDFWDEGPHPGNLPSDGRGKPTPQEAIGGLCHTHHGPSRNVAPTTIISAFPRQATAIQKSYARASEG